MTFPPEVETCDLVLGVETYDLGGGGGEEGFGGGEELVTASKAEVGDGVELGAGGVYDASGMMYVLLSGTGVTTGALDVLLSRAGVLDDDVLLSGIGVMDEAETSAVLLVTTREEILER